MMNHNSLKPEEAGFQFPCEYTVKAMGRNDAYFQAKVVSLIEPHTGPINTSQINSKPSSSAKYLSVTVTIQAQSRDQLDAIYQSLTDDNDVLMRL
jgi:putative lipoic acid-binding regulatory protein